MHYLIPFVGLLWHGAIAANTDADDGDYDEGAPIGLYSAIMFVYACPMRLSGLPMICV